VVLSIVPLVVIAGGGALALTWRKLAD